MKIDPGYYKVQIKKGYFGTTNHYMRVYIRDRKKYIHLDHGLPQLAENCEEDIVQGYHIVKKLTRPIEINHMEVTVKWRDEDGDEFVMAARNSYALNRIFELFPRLKKVFEV